MRCGIYMIENLVNGKKYIGQGIVKDRLRKHRSASHNELLRRAIKKYGKENFKFKILCYCELEELDRLETELIKLYRTQDRNYGYNFESGGHKNKRVHEETKLHLAEMNSGEGNPFYGKTHTEETRQKIREAHLERFSDSECKKELSELMKNYYENNKHPWEGRHHSDDTKKKISEGNKEWLKNNDNTFKGKKHTEESKMKMREGQKEWHKDHYSSFKGKKHTEENKKILSEKHQKYKNPVIATNLQTGEEKYYNAIIDVLKDGFNSSGVYGILNGHGRSKTCKGHAFRYATDEDIKKLKGES